MTTYGIFQILLVVIIFVYGWWYLFMKPKTKNTVDFKIDWKQFLEQNVKFYNKLQSQDKIRFENNIIEFLSYINIIGVETDVTDEDRLLVAASAVITTFGFEKWKFSSINEVLLYKDRFNREYDTEGTERNILGMVGEGALNKSMVISKPALHYGFSDNPENSNVGIHEFVHLLDKADGSTDGIPEYLLKNNYILPWTHLMYQKIEELKTNGSDINIYGATNEAEFFSVVSEYFFTQPTKLRENHPYLYEILEKVFNQKLI